MLSLDDARHASGCLPIMRPDRIGDMDHNSQQREITQQLRERIAALVERADAITRESDVLKQHSNELREEARKLLDELHGSGDRNAG